MLLEFNQRMQHFFGMVAWHIIQMVQHAVTLGIGELVQHAVAWGIIQVVQHVVACSINVLVR